MGNMLSSLGSFMGSDKGQGLMSLIGLGTTGAGLYGNIAAERQRQQAANAAKAYMNLTPQALAGRVAAAEQPLNQNLVRAVTGNVNANLAEQGLSEAPGLIAQATAQGLAPYQQMNQQTALDIVRQQLGLPREYASLIPPNALLGPGIAMLMKSLGSLPQGGRGTTSGMPPGTNVPAGTMPYPIPIGGPMYPSPTGPAWNPGLTPVPPPYTPDQPPDISTGGNF